MQEIMRRLVSVTEDPYSQIAEVKERLGRKVIGCFPMYLPEEIIHAARLLPVVMWESNEPITFGLAHILPFNCAIVRSTIDDAVKGKLEFMDGMVFYDTCMQARALPYMFETNIHPPYLEIIHLPPLITSPTSKDFLVENFMLLKVGLENLTGEKITDDALKKSIDIYNKNRSMLRRIYELRREKPGLLKASELVLIVWSSMLMPKEEHNSILEELIPILENKEVTGEGKTKIVLSGPACIAPRKDVLEIIEDYGMTVVDDDFFAGPRYFANDAKVDGDPMEALAERYLNRIPSCPTKSDWETDWTDYIIDMIKKNNAKGVVTLRVKYCPPQSVYYPHIKRKLADSGIPEIMLELEHEMISLAPMKTRLAAFEETIGGR